MAEEEIIPDWTSRIRDYDAEAEARVSELEPADTHPLEKSDQTPGGATDSALEEGTEEVDPLSGDGAKMDPLSMLLSSGTESSSAGGGGGNFVGVDDTFEPWSMKRQGILSKYTTNERISIQGMEDGDGKAKTVKSNDMSDKVKERLSELEDSENGNVQELLDMDQQQYIDRIDELNQELTRAWQSDQRVKALKIAIQCAKLLADTRVIQFYPSKFVLITDILDNFGTLVSNRIEEKAAYVDPTSGVVSRLPKNFTAEMVPDSAKETCRNWFFKIASIRELIPRLYVETAILKCYSFLSTGEYEQSLTRLTKMMRGIGDPLVATYARCYICRVGISVAAHVKTHLMPNFEDFLTSYKQWKTVSVLDQIKAENIQFAQYINLYVPALDWILQCIAYKASNKILDSIMKKIEEKYNIALLINSIMAAFPPEFISSRAVQFCELIRSSSDDGLPKHHLYRTLGMNVTLSAPPEDQRFPILNDVWKIVMGLTDPAEYIACAEVWIEYPVKFFGKREVNAMLRDCIEHMSPDRAFERYLPQLSSMLGKLLAHMNDYSVIFSMDKFLPFVDLFQKEDFKIDVCKSIVSAFGRNQKETTCDAVVLHAMMYITKVLHDSVTPMTFRDERKQITQLLLAFLSKIDFGQDFEQALNFYVDARAAFSNLDAVLVLLVHRVNTLAMQTHSVLKGRHNRKTSTFVRSCFAYSFITIPSIESLVDRLQLYLASGQCAILNQCLSQGDEFFKAAIKSIPDLEDKIEINGEESNTEEFLVPYCAVFLNTLVTVPDNPEQPALYLAKSLLHAITEFEWNERSDGKVHLFIKAMKLLAACSQPKCLIQIAFVDGNDVLYGSNPNYIKAISEHIDIMKKEVLEHIKSLGDEQTRQVKVILALFDCIISCADLSDKKNATLAYHLWTLADKAGASPKMKTLAIANLTSLSDRHIPGASKLLSRC